MIQHTPALAAVNKQILAEQSKPSQERWAAMKQAPGPSQWAGKSASNPLSGGGKK